MTSPMCQDSGPFREWAPLSALMQKMPTKIQVGLFGQDVNFTCLDAVDEFLAIGTNHGFVYWYNRKTEELETLGCPNPNGNITCIKVVSTVDFMLAAGTDLGDVIIFQVPKQVSNVIPEALKPKKKKQVERFNIKGLHQNNAMALEWSKNGMKLFSGDKSGLVVITEIDFYLHLSKSTELLNEQYSVVQLSYQSGLLLVSTLFRTIIVDTRRDNQVKQIGQTERKVLGKFGAVFTKKNILSQEPVIYASRPGLRIWQADKNGNVLKTLILKDAAKNVHNVVQLLNPAHGDTRISTRKDPSFNIIIPLSDDLLVSYNENVIYIVNPNMIMITSVISDLRRVTDVACTEDEIFILENERNVLRVACYPDSNFINENEFKDQPTLLADLSNPITQGLLEWTSKFKIRPIVPAIPFDKLMPTELLQSTSILPSVIIGTDNTSIINAEEALEIPPIFPLQLDTNLTTSIDFIKKRENNTIDEKKLDERKKIFQKIAEQEFEDIVFVPQKNGRKSRKKVSKPNYLPLNENTRKSPSNSTMNYCSQQDMETIQKAVQDKEQRLSTYLRLDLSEYMDKSITSSNNYLFESENDLTLTSTTCENSKEHNNPPYRETTEECKTTISEKIEVSEQAHGHMRHEGSDSADKKLLESNFNVLSKEFIKSTTSQETDDWILLG
ncbi:WD repeat-containing protein CG11141 isoform X2 [Phymastichus coffea]|uniref:WD repeat-containing protein CG11141 isoform X2 n=1 Tax=Phymastichus coffea TaxID=108790 RepID=UPI00273B8A11|nr:WD repeat-containing protein CG11141 isoform X2 [Phymastichus coffea]